MTALGRRYLPATNGSVTGFGALALGCLALIGDAKAACPAGAVELLPNVRALPPSEIAMQDEGTMQFSATSWNAGDGILELVARNPDLQQQRQAVDQRIYCSDGSYYDRPSGSAEYHAHHNHVHYNDYANYIFEEISGNSQNPRQGEKTTFCIMDTNSINTQLNDASDAAVFEWCPTQEPGFNTQGMSIGWGDKYGSNLPGQSLPIGDLAAGEYRLRHVFDPKNQIVELNEDDNESCRIVDVFDRGNKRYVEDLGPCEPTPQPVVYGITPASAAHNSCIDVTITGENLAPEWNLFFTEGSGPIPSIEDTHFDPAGNYVTATVCVPRAKGGKRKPRLGKDPLWDLRMVNSYSENPISDAPDLFTVTP